MSKKLLSVILAIVVMASLCIVNASAANDQSAKTGAIHAGDKVAFTASLKYGDETHLVAAINAKVTYDADVLKLENVKDVEYPVFGRATTNPNTPGEIIFNAADGVYGYDFSKGDVLVKVTFTVLKDAEATEVKFATEELFDVTVDPANNGQAKDGEAKKDITEGVTAAIAVDCPHGKTTDSENKTSDTEKVDTEKADTEKADTEKADDNTNTAPKTGDVATVAMMLVFAAAAVVLVSKKRA